MFHKTIMISAFCSFCIFGAAYAEIVVFPDPGLDAAVRQAIGMPIGSIRDTDLVGTDFWILHASDRNITDLTGVEHCTDLETVYLGSNQISDLSPLMTLTKLEALDLMNNQISNLEPLAGLTGLRRLFLAGNSTSDLSPLAGLSVLELLWLGECDLTLAPLASLTSLTDLGIGYSNISDISPLAGLTNLRRLSAVKNQIQDLTPLAGLTHLEYLSLYQNKVQSIAPLAGLTAITELLIGANQITDISALANMTAMDTLVADGNMISDLTPLTNLTKMTSLTLDGNNGIADISMLAGMTDLRYLHANWNHISNLDALRYLRQLHDVYLVGNQITDIMPLVQNSGLNSGAVVNLQNNPLSQEALCKQTLALGARWVQIFCLGTCESPEDCYMLDLIQMQSDTIALNFASAWNMPEQYCQWDIENYPTIPHGDGIPDLWQLRLFVHVYCNERHPLHSSLPSVYEANMETLRDVKPECANPWVAASLSLSTEMRTTICNLYGLDPGLFLVFTDSSPLTNEPFSAEGDCDGDGIDNLEEYLYVSSAGGDIEDFIMEAAENNHFWRGNPALPAAGAAGLALMIACLILKARKSGRLKSTASH